MQVLSAAQMQACDRLTAERFGIPSIELMRAAAKAVAAFAREQFPAARRVTVLCGRGNNGGDGMMAARLLALAGLEVTTLLLGSPDALSVDAAQAWRELTHPNGGPAQGKIHMIESAADLARHKSARQADLIVDAVVGTGFKPPLKGLALAVLEWIEGSAAPARAPILVRDIAFVLAPTLVHTPVLARAPILAIDLPSGWPADEMTATTGGPVFPADAVLTFTAPKPAHLFGQLTRHWSQPLVVAPIGSPPEAIEAAQRPDSLRLGWTGAAMEMVQAPRAVAANKGNFGHVLVVGGTMGAAGGKSGAPAMAALGALRSGAGLVTAAVPATALAVVSAIAPELMTWPLAATPAGSIAAENLAPEVLSALLAGKSILAIGPGLGQSPETAQFTLGLLAATRIPAVLDADALNILAAKLAGNPELLKEMARERTLVLTPHPGEMARLAGISVAAVQAGRLETARSFAVRNGVTLVLKGARTLIAHPDGRVAVNTTGNPGMAKGGSGDLLTGLISGLLAGLLAQHPDAAEKAVEAAVYLHGLAADLAVRAGDEHTLLATDSLCRLSQAFRFRASGPRGYVWLQGLPAEAIQAASLHEATS